MKGRVDLATGAGELAGRESMKTIRDLMHRRASTSFQVAREGRRWNLTQGVLL